MSDKTHLILFMTWDVSLALWAEKGLLQREIKLYQALAEKGVDVTLVSWGDEKDEAIAAKLLPDIKTISVYNHIPHPNNKALRALLSLLTPWALRRHIKAADILKTNQIWGGWVPAIASIFWRKPLIARCGFELYDFTKRQGHGRLRCAFTWLVSYFAYGTARRICVATREDKAVVIKHFGQNADKISVHPNWIDTKTFAPIDIPVKDKHVLFVGRLSAQKNLPALIDALEGSDYTLDIVGDGELREVLEAQSTRGSAKVNFLGKVPNDQLPALYNAYPVFILPSHYEGNPKTLLEAMSVGRAVIGTDVSGISSVIMHDKTGFLCSEDAASIRTALDRLMTDPTLRKRLGERARQQIIDTQTLDKLIDKELACYQLALQNVS